MGDKVKAADKVKWTTKMKKKHFVEVKGLFRERLNPRPDDAISAEGIRVEVQKNIHRYLKLSKLKSRPNKSWFRFNHYH